METTTKVCPCGEQAAGTKWHFRRGQESCAASKKAKSEYDKARSLIRGPRSGRKTGKTKRRGWVTGSPIEIPEVDPL